MVRLHPVLHLAVSAIGRDHPGIVAGVTGVLLDHDVNVEDSQMTILRGRFTMMLIVSAPDGTEVDTLRADLDTAGQSLGMDAVSVAIVDAPAGPAAEPSHIVTVYGVDHPGIVHSVAEALAGADVNITDLNTRLSSDDPDGNGDGAPEDLYVMMLEVSLPEGLSAAALTELLEATRREQGVEVSIRELESDEL
jgi:glycine cleavage system transcriptional repressor